MKGVTDMWLIYGLLFGIGFKLSDFLCYIFNKKINKKFEQEESISIEHSNNYSNTTIGFMTNLNKERV